MRFFAEIVGWFSIAIAAWWVFMLAMECLFVIIAAKWRGCITIGRLAIYFAAAGQIGTTTSFTTYGGKRYDLLFWYFFWRK